MASVPAFELNEQRLRVASRHYQIANFQVANFGLVLMVLVTTGGWIYTARALDRNSEAIRNFKPRIVAENVLGQTQLLTYKDLNTEPDERSIRSALSFWASYHLDHVRATVSELRSTSFAWMAQSYAESIQSSDRQAQYVQKVLTGPDPQYRVEVSNVVITSLEHKPDQTTSGAADIYAQRRYIGDDGLPMPVKASDAFTVHVKWALAAEIPNNLVGLNPLGIAVTYYNTYNSLR